MNNFYSPFILYSDVIEQSLKNTLRTYYETSCNFKNELARLPFQMDLLGDALHSKLLMETAHSRILYSMLQNVDIQRKFVVHFLPNVDCSLKTIQIPYPDKNRIDLTIKGDTFFLIIENKINGAKEQGTQINRYVQIAMQTYPIEEIYVLYLGGETSTPPSDYSISSDTRQNLGERLICINYKDDILPWITSVCAQVEFEKQPYLKSSLLQYQTYLENKYNIKKEMNNKLDKSIIETLGLDSMSLEEKIKVIDDQIDNIDKIRERLVDLLADYTEKQQEECIQEWYNICTKALPCKLTMEDKTEFGFNFIYRNTDFRCSVSFDDENEEPYWGIEGLTAKQSTNPKIFGSLKNMVLLSNKGFHDFEYNPENWVVSDYEKEEIIADKFITLSQLIIGSELCTIKKDYLNKEV